MGTTLGKTPKSAPLSNVSKSTPIASKAPSKANGKTSAKDAIEASSPAAAIRSVRASLELGEAIAQTDRIPSTFPLADLTKIKTEGRWAAGFRLDGGQLRLQWLSAKRFTDKDGKDGFEVFFFAQGRTVDRLLERMKDKGATSVSGFAFETSDLVEKAPKEKSRLAHTTSSFSPSKAAGWKLEQEGKYRVELCPDQPEALKGAVRIRLFGKDQDCSKHLGQVINQLGLQSMFAPPTPKSIERLKLSRMMWFERPELLDSVRLKRADDWTLQEARELIEARQIDPDGAIAQQIDAANLSDGPLVEKARQAQLLLERDPAAFIAWAKTATLGPHGIPMLGASDPEPSLTQALATAKLGAGTDAFKEAPKPDAEQVELLISLAWLVRSKPAEANRAFELELDRIQPEVLRKALVDSGISEARLDGLSLQEVYPGYFTVVDPSLPETLADAGACYLYSTSDNAPRVLEMLTGGQKSSFTRFNEGVLVKGKSSDADFGTGGAFSVFSRLVTRSAVQQGKKTSPSSGYSYGSTGSFNGWGGSRPYKLIINRRILARLDWYGYNGDNFGRSTNLKASNHGEELIRTINKSYSNSNELMFPVGSDPAFVDFVVCDTEQQKKALVEELEKAGFDSFNGRKLEHFVKVNKHFFEHPDDLTLDRAVKDAIEGLKLDEAETAVRDLVTAKSPPHIEHAVVDGAKAKVQEILQSAALPMAERSARAGAKKAASVFSKTPLEELGDKVAIEKAAEAAAKAAGNPLALGVSDAAALDAPTSSLQKKLEKEIRSGVEKAAKEAVAGQVPALVEQIRAGAGDLELPELIKKIKADVAEQLYEPAKAAGALAGHELGKPFAEDEVRALLLREVAKAAKKAAKLNVEQAAKDGAIKFAQGGLLDSLETQAKQAAEEAALDAARAGLEKSLFSKISSTVRQAARETVVDVVKAQLGEEVATAARSKAQSLAATAVDEAIKAFASEQGIDVSAKDKAAMHELAKTSLEGRIDEIAERVIKSATTTEANKKLPELVDPVTKAAIDASIESIAVSVAPDAAQIEASEAVQKPIVSAVANVAKTVLDSIADAVALKTADAHGPKLVAKLLEAAVEDVASVRGKAVAAELGREAAKAVEEELGPKT